MSISNMLNNGNPTNNLSAEWPKPFIDPNNLLAMMQNPFALNLFLQMQSHSLLPQQAALLNLRQLGFENPLDLTAVKPDLFQHLNISLNSLSKPEKVEEPSSTSKNSVRRNYTAEDLTQAVEDIRQGKLGTRRASVVYGIPRSTLRNKIYKLEAEGAMPSKNRRGVGQKTAPLIKPTETVTKSHSSSSSPRPSLYPSSPDSTNSSLESSHFTIDNLTKLRATSASSEDISNGSWVEALWQNLFKNQNTDLTSAMMKIASKAAEMPKVDRCTEEWKRSRPKRGQYRKYDKNALDEAVRSVRRGEMSVHRAGSYFGVPHSTLEYKVKERNLMRKKKESSTSNNSDIPTITLGDDPFVSSTDFEKQDDEDDDDDDQMCHIIPVLTPSSPI